MRCRALNDSGDWTFGSGRQSYAVDSDAVALNVRTRLRSWIGDCFFDLPMGIDWQNRLARFGQREDLDAEILRLILATDGVLSVDNYSSELSARHFYARYELNTIYSKSSSDVYIGVEGQNA